MHLSFPKACKSSQLLMAAMGRKQALVGAFGTHVGARENGGARKRRPLLMASKGDPRENPQSVIVRCIGARQVIIVPAAVELAIERVLDATRALNLGPNGELPSPHGVKSICPITPLLSGRPLPP